MFKLAVLHGFARAKGRDAIAEELLRYIDGLGYQIAFTEDDYHNFWIAPKDKNQVKHRRQ